MVIYGGAVKIKPEGIPAVLDALAALMPRVASVEGALEFTAYRGAADPEVLVVVEKYEHEEAHQELLSTDELKAFSTALWSSVTGDALGGQLEEIASLAHRV